MRKVLLVLVAAAAAVIGVRHYRNAPVREYKKFAEEILHRRYEAAAAMTDGLTPDDLSRQGSQERIGAGPAMFQSLFPSRFTIDSAEKGSDGVVTINATQTVLFTPPGVESGLPAMFAVLKQVTRLRNSGGSWKIVSFENTFDHMDSVRRR
jgi:hypothetical protein